MPVEFQRASAYLGPLGLLAVLAAAGYYLVVGKLDPVAIALLSAGVVLVLLYVWGNPDDVRDFIAGRQFRYSGNTLAMVLVFVAVVAMVNFLANRHDHRFDLTKNQTFTLAPQTISLLQRLDKPVSVKAFYVSGDSRMQDAQNLLKEYQTKTDKLSVEFIDPEINPAPANQLKITSSGTVVFQVGDRRQDATSATETSFDQALLKLGSDQQLRVLFVTGHGERALDSFDGAGLSDAKTALTNENFAVDTVNLATVDPATLKDAILIVAGPQQPFLPQELDVLRTFIGNGGKALLMQDPTAEADLNPVVTDLGAQFAKGVVLDPPSSLANNVGVLVVQKYQTSPITNDLGQTVFPLATAVEQTGTITATSYTTLTQTTDQSWLKANLKDTSASFDPSVDKRGPLSVAAALEKPVAAPTAPPDPADPGQNPAGSGRNQGPATRVVMIGNSLFATNNFMRAASNRDFLVNAVDWLAQSEELAGIRPRPSAADNSVFLTPTESNFVFLSSAVFLPALVLLAGGLVWWRRR